MKYVCENCKTEVLDSYTFCPECGGLFDAANKDVKAGDKYVDGHGNEFKVRTVSKENVVVRDSKNKDHSLTWKQFEQDYKKVPK